MAFIKVQPPPKQAYRACGFGNGPTPLFFLSE
jgi:hypothetical protein